MSKKITTNFRLVADAETTERFMKGVENALINLAHAKGGPKIDVQSLVVPSPSISLDKVEKIMGGILTAAEKSGKAVELIKTFNYLFTNQIYIDLGLPPKYAHCSRCVQLFDDELKTGLCKKCQPLYYEKAL